MKNLQQKFQIINLKEKFVKFTCRLIMAHSQAIIPFYHTVYKYLNMNQIDFQLIPIYFLFRLRFLFYLFHLVCRRCLFVNRVCVYVCACSTLLFVRPHSQLFRTATTSVSTIKEEKCFDLVSFYI